MPRRESTSARGGVPITIATPRAPLAAAWALRRIRELLDPVLVGRGLASEVPVPPRRLRARAGAAGAHEFVEGGRQAASELAGLLVTGGRPLAQLRSALDFGCGSGRVLPHLAALTPDCACAGCDVDQAAVEWACRHRPGLRWSLNSFVPPLPFAPESFELVYSISVFSHLDRGLQNQWLRELRRVLVPGGVALLSVHGPHAFEAFRARRVRTSWCPAEVFARAPLTSEEFVFVPYVRSLWNAGELPGVGRGYGLAFQGPDHVRCSWGRELQVVEVRERALTDWQDVVVCVK
jgi:SAM-dependent methyltransferase